MEGLRQSGLIGWKHLDKFTMSDGRRVCQIPRTTDVVATLLDMLAVRNEAGCTIRNLRISESVMDGANNLDCMDKLFSMAEHCQMWGQFSEESSLVDDFWLSLV